MRDVAREDQLRTRIVAVARRLHDRGLVAGAEGNVSARLDGERLLITPAGHDKSTLSIDDIVCVSIDGRDPLQSRQEPFHSAESDSANPGGNAVARDNSPRASSEVEMHRSVYRVRPDVGAVVHGHPPVATGFAASGRNIPSNILSEFPAVVGAIALVPYARPGTKALGEAIKRWVSTHDVLLLSNHGVTTVGLSLESALQRMESVEQGARSIFVAMMLGGAVELPPGETEALSSGRIAI